MKPDKPPLPKTSGPGQPAAPRKSLPTSGKQGVNQKKVDTAAMGRIVHRYQGK